MPYRSVTGDIADRALMRKIIAGDVDAVFHLAAVVSSAAEADFDLGMHVNFDGTRVILEACRKFAAPPRVVFASSVAVFGGDMPTPLTDQTALTPQTSYGVQKTIGELLVNDMSRKGFIDGRALRLPTIVVRPGKPNKAASTFASSIIREPLGRPGSGLPGRGRCPHVVSCRRAASSKPSSMRMICRASAWGWNRSLDAARHRCLGRRHGREPPPRRRRALRQAHPLGTGRDHQAHRRRLALSLHAGAPKMGFKADKDMDEIIAAHIEDELGGKWAA